jgi:hypothetical protein
MSEKLQEFAVGKAGMIADKLFSILTRRTGVKFTVQQSLVPYHNRWGKFVGKFAFTPDGKCFRLNFLRGSSDEAVSLDYWAKGKNPYKCPPNYVMSFEGWGIAKIFSQIEEFVKGNFKFEESTEAFSESFHLTEETVKEVFGLYAAKNPAIITSIASGGFDDSDMFAKLKIFMSQEKIKTPPGFAKGTLANTIKSYLKAVAAGKISNNSIPPTQAATAAKQIPAAEIADGKIEGPSVVDANLFDVLDPALATKVNDLIASVNRPDGAFGIIRQFETQIRIATARNVGARLVVACGRAGTGKTFTVTNFLEYGEGMGFSIGSGYVKGDSIKFIDEDDVKGFFCLNASIPIIVFDDADQLFISRSAGVQNIMKHVLDPDRKNRVLSISKDKSAKTGGLPAGDYVIDSKLIWCTNLQPGALNSAILDRMMQPANVFNFTDQEILDLVKSKLDNVYDEFPGLSQEEILDVFMFFQSIVNHVSKKNGYTGEIEGISFRNFKATLTQMETYKFLKLNVGDIWRQLTATFGIQRVNPAKVVASA